MTILRRRQGTPSLTKTMRIDVYTHFIEISELTMQARLLLRQYLGMYLRQMELTKQNGRWVKVPSHVFARIYDDKNRCRMHINTYPDFIRFLKAMAFNTETIETHIVPLDYKPKAIKLKFNPNIKPRDYQEAIVEQTIGDDVPRKVIALPTGEGKTTTALWAAMEYGQRTVIMLLPTFIDKWIEDITGQLTNIGTIEEPLHYYVINTRKKLDNILNKKTDINPYYIFILSMTTYRSYLDEYYEASARIRKKMVPPHKLWSILKVGFRITDEAHMHFRLNYLIDLDTHMPKSAYLSATLHPTDPFLKRRYDEMFPLLERMGEERYKAYIECHAVFYKHHQPESWNCYLQGRYSHVNYENCFRSKRRQPALQQYFDMIYGIIEKHYLNIRQPEQKAIIFFNTVLMCDRFVDYLKRKLPDLDIRRYVSEDDYENIMTAEIAVSTPGSAGTGIDIRGLILNVMTMSLMSNQANLQIMGRLRKLVKWPDQNPRFFYLVSEDIPASVKYHEMKQKLFKNRVLKHDIIKTDVVL